MRSLVALAWASAVAATLNLKAFRPSLAESLTKFETFESPSSDGVTKRQAPGPQFFNDKTKSESAAPLPVATFVNI